MSSLFSIEFLQAGDLIQFECFFSLSVKDWYARDRTAENFKQLNDFIHKKYLSYEAIYFIELIQWRI